MASLVLYSTGKLEIKVMFLLKQNEISQLNRIRRAVDNNSSLPELRGLCTEISSHIKPPNFPFTYAGILLASQNKISEAIQLFDCNKDDVFSSVVGNYLKKTGCFAPATVVFKSATPYNAWIKTNFYKTHHFGVLKNLEAFIKNNPLPLSERPITILDVGTGNGVLITDIVNQLSRLSDFSALHLVLLDPSSDMLRTAEEYCKKNIRVPLQITTLCCKAEEISDTQIETFCRLKPIWLTTFAFSIHHMPRELKIPMLEKINKLTSNCLLIEINWNHDRPEKDSPELAYSVAGSYGYMFNDILKSPLTAEEKELSINHFFLAEAINILKNDRMNRIDYHTTIDEWKKIATVAGYHTGQILPTVTLAGEPFAFTMELLKK